MYILSPDDFLDLIASLPGLCDAVWRQHESIVWDCFILILIGISLRLTVPY
jgi:hypothetical protein